MANLTKTQAIKRAQKLKDQIDALLLEIEELQSDLQEEADDVEPYEGKDDLTLQQEERQEWLQEAADQIQEALDQIQEGADQLELY